jgi:hypothetical protein
MLVPVRVMTTVRSPRGSLVHVTSLSSPGRTACNARCQGWIVVPAVALPAPKRRVVPALVTCMECKAAIFFKVRR